jgi:TolB-like protein/Tfp pilus assembly protein PilF
MSDAANKAVFLSYASQDAEAARRIADALRAAGVEVWFDQNELVGGDAWDAKIRKQIKECALLIPIISAATQARREGYFRLEWRLADQRTHLMAKGLPFLLPVVIDDTRDAEAHVPDSFAEVQWTKLPAGETTLAFAARVKNLLGGVKPEETASRNDASGPSRHGAAPARKPASRPWLIFAPLGLVAVLGFALWRPWQGPLTPESGKPVEAAKLAGPLTEAQKLVAKARVILDEGDEINRENYALAEDFLRKAEALDPTEASAWALHAQLSASLHWFSFDVSPARREAMRLQASRALALAPESDDAQLGAVRVQIELDQNQAESLRALEAIVKRSPENWQAWRHLARCLRKQGDAAGALAALRQALKLSANHPAVINDLFNHLTNVGEFAEAERAIRELPARRDSARLLAHELFNELYWRGNPAGTAAMVASWPGWFLAEDRGAGHAALAALWNRDPAQAQKILATYPRDYLRDYLFTGPRAVLTAWANEQAGNEEAAQADWRNARQITERILGEFPDDREALYWKAWALARLGDRPGATGALRLLEQREARTNGLFFFGGLAGLKAALGDIEGAVDLLAKVRVNLPLNIKPVTKAFLALNPVFDPLRGNARFQALVGSAPAPAATKESATVTPPKDEKSVAVLAFANLSDDKANEYFSDGISEELLNVLAKIPGLKVTARTSSFYFKGKEVPVPEIARQLGVAYVVEGSVRKQGDKVRITAQLIKADGGFHVWSDTFTRDLKDIFAVQDEIAGLIARQLSLEMGVRIGAPANAVNAQVFEFYVQARQAWNLRTPEGLDQAEELLNHALTIEPNFARGHAALANVWSTGGAVKGTLGAFNQRDTPEVSRIQAAIDRALALDPNLAEAHVAQGSLASATWKTADAQRSFRRAIELNPGDATAHQFMGRALVADGRLDEAVAELKRAAELDPLSHRILDNYAIALRLVGRPAEALVMDERALALQPSSRQAMVWRALDLSALGRHAEALELVRRLPSDLGYGHFIAQVFMEAGQRAEAEAAIAWPGTERAYGLAVVGRWDEALKELEAAKLNSVNAGIVCVSSVFDPIRSDPRFRQALEQLGLSEAHARAQAWRAAHPFAKPEAKK